MRTMEYLAQRNAAADTFLYFFFLTSTCGLWERKKTLNLLFVLTFFSFFLYKLFAGRSSRLRWLGKALKLKPNWGESGRPDLSVGKCIHVDYLLLVRQEMGNDNKLGKEKQRKQTNCIPTTDSFFFFLNLLPNFLRGCWLCPTACRRAAMDSRMIRIISCSISLMDVSVHSSLWMWNNFQQQVDHSSILPTLERIVLNWS